MTGWQVGQLCALVVLCGGTIDAQAAPGEAPPAVRIVDVAVGLNGRYKIGRWMPVVVTVVALQSEDSGRVEVTCPDGDGRMATYAATIQLVAGQTARATVFVRPGQWQRELAVAVRSRGGEILAQQTVPAETVGRAMPLDQELLLLVGPPIGIDAANELVERSTGQAGMRRRIEVVAYGALDQLPGDHRGLDAVDTIIVSTSRLQVFQATSPNASSAEALRRWVELGGRLVISVGREASRVLGEGSPLRWTAPGEFGGLSQLDQLGALETYIDATETAGERGGRVTDEPGQGIRLQVASLRRTRGRWEVPDSPRSGTLPLVLRRAVGLGQVTFVAFDLDSPALAQWPGRGRLINRLLERKPPTDATAQGPVRGDRSAKAYVDLEQQFRDALNQFAAASTISVGGLLAALVCFLVVVGPIDYYLVRRRPQRTWLTFALWIGIFLAGGAWIVGRSRPDSMQVNQVEVIDIDTSGGERGAVSIVRGNTWFDLYTPRAECLSTTYTPAGLWHDRVALSDTMTALPTGGRSFQGASALPLVDSYAEPYRIHGYYGELQRLSIAAGGTQGAFVEWRAVSTKLAAKPLAVDPLGRPRGAFVQPLEVPLEDCVLFAGAAAFRLGRLAPGETIKIDDALELQSAAALLTRRRLVEDRQTAAAYDHASLDVSRVLEMILFHELAGGRDYTRLENHVYGRLDMSRLLALDRAVLVGISRQPQGKLAIKTGADQADEEVVESGTTLTVYRFVIPLERS
jgi:hypothetical protein